MLDELIEELEHYKEIEKENNCLKKDKHRMSEELYKYMMKEYERLSREEIILLYNKEFCKHCRHLDYCGMSMPEDLLKPIKSEKDWIPAKKTCGDFEFS